MLKVTRSPHLVKNSSFQWTIVGIGLLYLYLLAEHITLGMSFFFVGCMILAGIPVRANIPLKILLITFICLHHGFFYGLNITTEAALNFILGMTGLKMLEQQEFRDRHLLLFIFLLLLNAALLFEKSIFIFSYVILSLFSLVFVMSTPRFEWRYLWNALKSLLIVSPFILGAYFFFPRWNSQLLGDFSIAGNAPEIHKIGLSLDIDFKHLTSLEPNSALSFLAFVEMMNKPLYWRSHTLTQTDGWNWERSTSDTLFFKAHSPSPADKAIFIQQKIQLENLQRYFIGLDRSVDFRIGEVSYYPDSYSLSYQFPTRSTLKSYHVSSFTSALLTKQKLSSGDLKNLLHLPVNKTLFPKLIFNNSFELQAQLREHFRKIQFSYSYEPGLIRSVEDFLRQKKGFCSHFASYTALLLRANDVPARLVSGYLGGERNPQNEYYRVVENDAHVWVEAFYDHSWIRLDPTLWVSSIRAEGGNVALIANNKNMYSLAFLDFFMEKQFPKTLRYLTQIKYFIEKTNSDFQFWLENFNLSQQSKIAKKWHLTINEFYLIGLMTMFISLSLMSAWILYRSQNKSPAQTWIVWQKFWMGLEKNFPDLSSQKIPWGALTKIEHYLQESQSPKAAHWKKKLLRLKKDLNIS